MDTSSLSRLPNEILSIIFGHFCLHCQDYYNQSWDKRPLRAIRPCREGGEDQHPDARSWYSVDRNTLFAACLASKGLRDIAQPILYHEFALGYGDSWKSKLYTWHGRLASFIRTLARRPDLARKVKVVYIHTDLFGINKDESQRINRSAILEAARALGFDLLETWHGRISKASLDESWDWPETYPVFLRSYLDERPDLTERDARHLRDAMADGPEPGWRWLNAELVTMIIAQMPNLQYLSLQGGPDLPTHGLPESSLPALGIESLRLETLDLGIAANPVVRLSSGLRTLNLHQYTHHFRKPIKDMPCLKTLRITDTIMSADMLQSVLNACTGGLVVFEYEAGRDKSTDERPNVHFQPSDAIDSLGPHRHSLEVLHLDLTSRGVQMRKVSRETTLQDFNTLQHISINTLSLFEMREEDDELVDDQLFIRLLPRSVVSLAIYRNWPYSYVKETLLGLAHCKRQNPEMFPSLNWVGIRLRTRSLSLESALHAAGIEMGHNFGRLSKVKQYLQGPNSASSMNVPIPLSDEDL